jgi:uncharacterized protein
VAVALADLVVVALAAVAQAEAGKTRFTFMIPFYKLLFAAIISCFLIFISCKNHSHNKGEHKITAATLTDADSALKKFMHFFADTLPLPINYVNDYENLFSAEQEIYLNNLIDSFKNKTNTQIAVATIDQIMVSKQNFEPLTLQLANAWGVGNKNENNEILIGICAGYKKLRIQNGKGIEPILSDSATKIIIDSSFIAYFKTTEYFLGTVNGVRAIIQKLDKQ